MPMTPLNMTIVHINASLPKEIDERTFIAGRLTHKINRISWDRIPGKESSGNL